MWHHGPARAARDRGGLIDAAAALAALLDPRADPGDQHRALAALGVPPEREGELQDRLHRRAGELARLRRREQDLAALLASARELAELRDADLLLDRLVDRAQALMGVDIAYLSEFEPATRTLRVRTAVGSVSEGFRTLVVPPGAGLASAVVESMAPETVLRYDEYPVGRHERSIDAAVHAEGIVSMLGVPMISSDVVLGVLFVGTRVEHEFTPDEIVVLQALADHASVVLQTTRVLLSLQHSEEQSRSALNRLTEHLGERDRANAVHQDLVHAVLAGGGFEPLAATLSTALRRAVVVVDSAGSCIASCGVGQEGPELVPTAAVRSAIDSSAASGHCLVLPAGEPVVAVAALAAGPRRFGGILLGTGAFELGSVDRRTIERAAQVGTLLALQQEAVTEAEQRMHAELVADLVSGDPGRRSDLDRRLRRLGITASALDSLVVFTVPGEHRSTAARLLAEAAGPGSLVGEHQGRLVLARTGNAAPPVEELRARLASSVGRPVLAVLPGAATEPPAGFAAAVRTSQLLAALGATDITAAVEDFLPYSAVLDADPAGIAMFLDRTIGDVRRYDEQHRTGLVATLRALVRCGGSPTRAARALNYHPNTITQRLDRLDRVLGADWRDDERLFRITIAVRLDELRERLARPEVTAAH